MSVDGEIKSKWTELTTLAGDEFDLTFSRPFITKKGEILMLVLNHTTYTISSVVQYDFINDQISVFWNIGCKLNYFMIGPIQYAYDEINSMIYINCKKGLYTLNLEEKEVYHIPVQNTQQAGWDDCNTRGVVIGDQLHTFGIGMGKISAMHTIYNITRPRIDHRFIDNALIRKQKFEKRFCIFYIKSQQKLLFFSGNFGDNITSCDMSKGDFNMDLAHTIKLSKALHTPYDPGFIATPDGKYMIIIDVWRESMSNPGNLNIEILDVENGTILNKKNDEDDDIADHDRKSLLLPGGIITGNYSAFLVNTHRETITNGYLRNCWNQQEFTNLEGLPFEVAVIIGQFYTHKYYVHLLRSWCGYHWKIPLADIFWTKCRMESEY